MEAVSFFLISLITLLFFCAYIAFAQWRNTRDGVIPWYIGYLLAADFHYLRQFLINISMHNGYPPPPDIPLRWDNPLTYISMICYMLFLDKVLDFKNKAPRLNYIFRGFALFYTILLVLNIGIQIFLGYAQANGIYQVSRILLFPMMLFAIVFLFRQAEHFYQKLILLGCVFLTGGMLSAILSHYLPWHDIFPDILRAFKTPWGTFYFYHMKVGIFWDVICFSWALTLLQKHKMKAGPLTDPLTIQPNVASYGAVEPSVEFKNKEQEIFLEQVNKFLSENFSNAAIGVQDLAKQIYLSPSQTTRRIKEITGLTTEQYIRNYRLSKAYQLLQDPSKSITDVALDVGFKDIPHFSTCFKKQYGLNPSKVRRSRESLGMKEVLSSF